MTRASGFTWKSVCGPREASQWIPAPPRRRPSSHLAARPQWQARAGSCRSRSSPRCRCSWHRGPGARCTAGTAGHSRDPRTHTAGPAQARRFQPLPQPTMQTPLPPASETPPSIKFVLELECRDRDVLSVISLARRTKPVSGARTSAGSRVVDVVVLVIFSCPGSNKIV